MTKKIAIIVTLFLFIGLSAFSSHKFYVSISQFEFVPEKKRVEITARIFTDDLNRALSQEFKTKSSIGEKSETSQDLAFLQKYLKKNLHVSIDGKEKPILYLSKETNNTSTVIYLKINDVKKINSIKIQNTILMDVYSSQQNIIQTNFNKIKQNFTFTKDYFIENISFK